MSPKYDSFRVEIAACAPALQKCDMNTIVYLMKYTLSVVRLSDLFKWFAPLPPGGFTDNALVDVTKLITIVMATFVDVLPT